MAVQFQILIIGGGTAGIMTATQLLKRNKNLKIGIIEPSEKHYYQPAWTLVGGGAYTFKKTWRYMADLIPKKTTWIKDYAVAINPHSNSVTTQSKKVITYNYLVIAPGLIMAPELIEGLPEAIEKGVACSIYMNPENVWSKIKGFKGKNIVFTQPTTPIKCGGAPQKIAYLTADYFRKKRQHTVNITFATPGSVIFGVEPIQKTLMNVIKRYGIHFKPFYSVLKVDADKKVIYFKNSTPGENKCIINEDDSSILNENTSEVTAISFDLLHIAPPQTAPKFIKESILANDDGWLNVDHHSLQHNRFTNIFGLGDVAGLPTAKTGAAIRKQVPVVVDNIIFLMEQNKLGIRSYNGYSSCPLVTGYGKMVLAEFDYQGQFTPDPKLKRMFIFNSEKEHWRLWLLKKIGLPYLYWNKMMKGKNV